MKAVTVALFVFALALCRGEAFTDVIGDLLRSNGVPDIASEKMALGADTAYRLVVFSSAQRKVFWTASVLVFADETKAHIAQGLVVVRRHDDSSVKTFERSLNEEQTMQVLEVLSDEEVFSLPTEPLPRDDGSAGSLLSSSYLMFERWRLGEVTRILRVFEVSGPVGRARDAVHELCKDMENATGAEGGN